MEAVHHADARARLLAVEAAVSAPEFQIAMADSLRRRGPGDIARDELRALAAATLAAQGVDTAGVSLRLTWDGEGKRIDVWVRPESARPTSPG